MRRIGLAVGFASILFANSVFAGIPAEQIEGVRWVNTVSPSHGTQTVFGAIDLHGRETYVCRFADIIGKTHAFPNGACHVNQGNHGVYTSFYTLQDEHDRLTWSEFDVAQHDRSNWFEYNNRAPCLNYDGAIGYVNTNGNACFYEYYGVHESNNFKVLVVKRP
jgi:hypothetical protein